VKGWFRGVLVPTGLMGFSGIFVEQKRIQLLREKLIIFRYRQCIVGSTFHWLSEDTVRFEDDVGVCEKFAKM